jgi:prepilin-type N-terminal cleavage/methylation domain-containing protein
VRRAATVPRATGRGQDGFSFLEVLMAMSVLLLGAVAILALFALAVNDLIVRRVESKLDQVRSEVVTLAQDAVDRSAAKGGSVPEAIPASASDPPRPLSAQGYAVRITFERAPYSLYGVTALAHLYYQGAVVEIFPPLPITRSTLAPP